MRFEGRVWRYVPRDAHPLDFQHLIRAAGRGNRRGLYGCLYTALAPTGAIAEHRKHERRRGLARPRDLVALDVAVDPVFDVVAWAKVETGRRARHPGQALWLGAPPKVALTTLAGDRPADLEACRSLADWARNHGYLALYAPSAAVEKERVLAIYPENLPEQIDLRSTEIRYPLNYGAEAILDAEGNLRVAAVELGRMRS